MPEPVHAYHLTSAEHAISSIGLSRLKVARISEVNDPFELFAVNCKKKQVRRALKSFRDIHDARLGFLSFSKSWKNPVLWSHYADRHRGVCLGFEIAPSLQPKDIQYDTEKLRIEPDKGVLPYGNTIPKDVQDLLMVTKFAHWAYEEEVRVMLELARAKREGSLYFWPFDEQLRLRDVILGHRCSLTLDHVRTLVRTVAPGALVSKARLGFGNFEVRTDNRFPPA